jgi:hypothetical protein
MLFLLQAAAQHLPPINITVQQPAGGIPEWAKILISASVGAAFAVGTNAIMEFIKPAITKRSVKSMVVRSLINEVNTLLETIDSCLEAVYWTHVSALGDA